MIIGAALALTLMGVAAAWQVWRTRRRLYASVAVVALLLVVLLWWHGFGAEIGLPLASVAASVVALLFILSRIEIRPYRAPKPRRVPSPPAASWRWGRGLARTIVAGPLGFAAAAGAGVAFASAAPLQEQTRLILGGLLVPALWSAFLIWGIAAARLGRAAGSFAAIGTAGFLLALLPRG
jgi:hypothetical protein